MNKIEPQQHQNPNTTKESKMGTSPTTKSTGPHADSQASRAPAASGVVPEAPSAAERIVNMSGTATARRRAWWVYRFNGEQLYMAAWMTALLASVLGVG